MMFSKMLEKDKYYMISLIMQNLKNTIECICKIETDSEIWKTNLWLPKRREKGRDKLGVWD